MAYKGPRSALVMRGTKSKVRARREDVPKKEDRGKQAPNAIPEVPAAQPAGEKFFAGSGAGKGTVN